MFEKKYKVDGERASVSLSLSKNEVETALSICENNGVGVVYAIKKNVPKAKAVFFVSERHATGASIAHKTEIVFPVEKPELETALKKAK